MNNNYTYKKKKKKKDRTITKKTNKIKKKQVDWFLLQWFKLQLPNV